jgi:hypothetical protein
MISAPSALTASMRHERTVSGFTMTVQVPHTHARTHVGAGQAQCVAQDVDEQPARLDRDRVVETIDCEGNRNPGQAWSGASARRAARPIASRVKWTASFRRKPADAWCPTAGRSLLQPGGRPRRGAPLRSLGGGGLLGGARPHGRGADAAECQACPLAAARLVERDQRGHADKRIVAGPATTSPRAPPVRGGSRAADSASARRGRARWSEAR